MKRLLNTVRYLKPVQIYWRFRPKPRQRQGNAPSTRALQGSWTPHLLRAPSHTGASRFRFLNQERDILTWNDSSVPKLWLYNLHYFDCPDAVLIERWIAENPVGHGVGWEPYPLSLRICNWIKWALSGSTLNHATLQSLARQARYLAGSLEYHLLANHLFANAKALIFAGVFFEGRESTAWLSTGLRILNKQISEQILHDGGHFERSPMYHAIILEDVLDLINLGRAFPGLLQDLHETARNMLGWLEEMTHPDGQIAFFNDAAFGVAPEPCELIEYAGRLGITPNRRPLSDSGYVRLENNDAVVLFDAAPVGPDYQPGHAHADTLSFELSLRGRRAIVNSGISTYENNPLRHRQRSTSAHNTVAIDGQNSSEVWAAFRVARRARPSNTATDHRTFAESAHDGYTRLSDPVIHFRRLELSAGELRIIDTIRAKREHSVEIYFHLHPASKVQLRLDLKLVRTDEPSHWYPEFNKAESDTTVVGRWKGICPVSFDTRIPLCATA